jgi:bacterioferritin-associated ferredoxin
MIVCLCHGVNDREIRSSIEAGAGTVREVGTKCGAGTDCGGCKRQIKQMIQGHDALRAGLMSAGKSCSKPRLTVLATDAR